MTIIAALDRPVDSYEAAVQLAEPDGYYTMLGTGLKRYVTFVKQDDGVVVLSVKIDGTTTVLVRYYPNYRRLYTGGYHTATTRELLNTLIAYRAVVRSSQLTWYVYVRSAEERSALFTEGLALDYGGRIVEPQPVPESPEVAPAMIGIHAEPPAAG